jgi:hypothetical protein
MGLRPISLRTPFLGCGWDKTTEQAAKDTRAVGWEKI